MVIVRGITGFENETVPTKEENILYSNNKPQKLSWSLRRIIFWTLWYNVAFRLKTILYHSPQWPPGVSDRPFLFYVYKNKLFIPLIKLCIFSPKYCSSVRIVLYKHNDTVVLRARTKVKKLLHHRRRGVSVLNGIFPKQTVYVIFNILF